MQLWSCGERAFSSDTSLSNISGGKYKRDIPSTQGRFCQGRAAHRQPLKASQHSSAKASTDQPTKQAAATLQVLVVVGNVEEGSSVTSEGDICILGRLSGVAHAGSGGNRRAVIRALQLDSERVSIAGVSAAGRLTSLEATLVVCGEQGLALKSQHAASPGSLEAMLGSFQEQENAKAVKAAAVQQRKGLKSQKAKKVQAVRTRPFSLAALRRSKPAMAAFVTGAYILVAGLLLLLAPLKTFTILFDQRSVAPSWIRVGGVLASLFGFYYLGAAHGEVTNRGLLSFYESTIMGRAWLALVFCLLVALKKSQWQLLILAAANLAGAASMQRAIRV